MEYSSFGPLSNPSGSASIVGPITAEQAQIPQGIKDARVALYLIEHDASTGIHRPPYACYLFKISEQQVSS
jgi:hypothetical protein